MMQCTRLALQKGWFVEQWARRGSLNHLYIDLAKEYSKTMRIRYIDDIQITATPADKTATVKVNAFKTAIGAELVKLQTALVAVCELTVPLSALISTNDRIDAWHECSSSPAADQDAQGPDRRGRERFC